MVLLSPPSVVLKGSSSPIDDDPARERWTKAAGVHSVMQAVSISKLVWHNMFDVATAILDIKIPREAQERAGQAVAFQSKGAIHKHWLLNLGTVHFAAYSQYFSEKCVKSAVSELSKYTDLVVVDKRQTKGCKDESMFVSGTNVIGCSISKALKLSSAATRRLESSNIHIHFKSMRQRWVRHDDHKGKKETWKALVEDFPYMLKQDHLCAELSKTIRRDGGYPLALVVEESQEQKRKTTESHGRSPQTKRGPQSSEPRNWCKGGSDLLPEFYSNTETHS